MDMIHYEFSLTELQHQCNNAFAEAVAGLEKEGLLKTDATDILSKYAIVVHRKGVLGYIWDKAFGQNSKGAIRFRLMKSTA